MTFDNIKSLRRPTRLYIKQCSHCNLKYFGKTISEDIENYPGSGVRWTRHLSKHRATSKHLWNSDWYYDTTITRFAIKFSVLNRIVESKGWANLAIENGIQGGFLGEEISKKAHIKISKTKNSANWKLTVSKEAGDKISECRRDPTWQENVGKAAFIEAGKTQSITKQSLVWKETIGKRAKERELETKGDPKWIQEVGLLAIDKFHQTTNTEEWQTTIGKERNAKLSVIAKNRPKLLCIHCNNYFSNPNFSRWHGENCKFNI